MKTPLNAKAERFATALDAGIPTQRSSADPAEIELLQLARSLSAAGHVVGPAPVDTDFRAALRQRLVAVATVQQPEPEPSRARVMSALSLRVNRRIGAVAGSVAILTGVAGVGIASARSLPGDPFYGIKRETENIQLWAARGDTAKGRRHLEFAKTRLTELHDLHDPSATQINSSLGDMDSQTRQGTAELVTAAHSEHSAQPLAELATFARQQVSGLVTLARSSTPAERVRELRSIQVLGSVQVQLEAASRSLQQPTTPLRSGTPKPHTPSGVHPTPHPSPRVSASSPAAPGPVTRHGSTAKPTPHASSSSSHGILPTPSLPISPTLPNPLPTVSKLLHSLLP